MRPFSVSTAPTAAGRISAQSRMKTGLGVLLIALAQLVGGLCMLGIYEGYKAYYYNRFVQEFEQQQGLVANDTISGAQAVAQRVWEFESPLDFRSPMGFVYWLAVLNNIFSVAGLAGIINTHRELTLAFFVYSAAQMVVGFHFFVDMLVDATIKYGGEPAKLSSYEKAAAAFILLNFVLSVAATLLAVKAIDEIKTKQREEYHRLTLTDASLPFEPDIP